MNLYFEKLKTLENLLKCNDVNSSGIKRFTTSPLISTLVRHKETNGKKFKNFKYKIFKTDNAKTIENYIIATGVNHSPDDWTGFGKLEEKNLFNFLNDKSLKDLRKNKAYLLLDQSHEGYHTAYLFEWFHESCKKFKISPSRIIYVTGDLDVERKYEQWASDNLIEEKLCVVGYPHFEHTIYHTWLNGDNKITYDDHLDYKINNLNNIKVYNCLQKRPRGHRIFLFKGLIDNNLLDYGINTMNSIGNKKTYYNDKILEVDKISELNKWLPMLPPDNNLTAFSDSDCGNYLTNLNQQIMLDSFISIVSEASFAENTCFLSEKIFKPIINYHPFIIYGNKYSLEYLKDLGYKTFDGLIDESYDKLESWERHEKILKEIKKLTLMSKEDLLEWFKKTREICEHNFNIITENSVTYAPTAIVKISKYL